MGMFVVVDVFFPLGSRGCVSASLQLPGSLMWSVADCVIVFSNDDEALCNVHQLMQHTVADPCFLVCSISDFVQLLCCGSHVT
jgi:hypothetical protein